MPELPEVETTRRGIMPHILQHKVVKVIIRQYSLRWPIRKDMAQLLINGMLKDVHRRGKYLLLEFDCGTALIHLGMSGSIRILESNSQLKKHDHFDIHFSNGKILRYNDPRRFGAFIWAGDQPYQHDLLVNLGVEPLENDFDAAYLFSRSRTRKVAVKSFIMNAQVVVGVGNIYANETLFLAGISPIRAANKISFQRYQLLVSAIKKILSNAIKQGGTTLKDFNQVDGKPGYFAQSLQVYGRAGQKCLNCDSILQEIRQTGRATVFCKQCQS